MNNVSIGEAFGRVNLIGEHLDYNAGCVMPLQINRSVKVTLKKNNAIDGIKIRSENYTDEISINILDKKLDNWADFIIGSCVLFKKKFNVNITGIIFEIQSNLPIGIGVSSSAAVTVSSLKALSSFYKIEIENEQLVQLAHSVERDFVGVAGGIMDQFVSIYGVLNKALFLDTKSNNFELLQIPEDYEFLVIDSGIQRMLTDGSLNKKKDQCLIISKKLKIEKLCQLNSLSKNQKKILSKNNLKIAEHVIFENQRSKSARVALINKDMYEFGNLMTQSHNSLSNLYEVSIDELDYLVELCNSFGALGSKLTGAGFGGAIVTLIKKDFVEELKKYIIKNYSNAKFL